MKRYTQVLLIEDNPSDARLIQELLGEVSDSVFRLEWVERLSLGISRLEEGAFDAVLLDLSLPDAQGVETITRTREKAAQIPIIILTGLDDERMAITAVRQGAQDYLVKGKIDSALLGRAICYAIERKQMEHAIYLMSDTQRLIANLDNLADLYQLVGRKIQELIGDGYTAISMFDENLQAIKIVGLYGFGDFYENLVRMYKIDPFKIVYPLKEMTAEELRQFRSGRLEIFTGGLYNLLVRQVPKPICDAVEIQLKITDLYTMGFVWHNLNFGGITIFAKRDITPYKDMIETIVNQTTITIKRIRSEEALRASEDRFRTLFEQAAVGVALVETKTGRYIRINQKYCDFLGFTVEEMLNKTFQDITYPEDTQLNIDNNRLLIAGKIKEFSIEKRYIRKDGSVVWGKLTASPLWKADEKPETFYHIAVVEDITERRLAEEKILQLNERLEQRVIERTAELKRRNRELSVLYTISRATAESLELEKTLSNVVDATLEALEIEIGGIYLLEPDGVTLTLRVVRGVSDETVTSLYRVKLGEGLSGKAVAEKKPLVLEIQDYPSARLFPTLVCEGIQSSVSIPLLSGGQAMGALNLSARHPRAFPAEELELLTTIAHLLGNALQNAQLYETLRQRTMQMEDTNKELEAFSYSVSHDLRAPLRGIDGWSISLMEDYYDQLDDQGRECLNYIRSEAQRMGKLIEGLLQLSRLNRYEIQDSPLDLAALASIIMARLKKEQPERRVEVIIQPGLMACGDPTLIEVMLTNLLSNAWKFTSPRVLAQIEFGQTEEESNLIFYVRDNGVGFDMAYAKKLFGVFQRMHKSTDFSGTGIGLATVQRIINRHGGQVWAEAHVDQGATFFFTLRREHV